MGTPAPSFELVNVGPGPDPCTLADLAEGVDTVVLYFQRSGSCRFCRRQVQAVADRHPAFREREAAVASVLPEPRHVAGEWQDRYDLPFPLLADPGATVGDAYSQPVRFGQVGARLGVFGRLPQVLLIDVRTDPNVAWRHQGTSTFDRPDVDAVLDRIDRLRASDPPVQH